MLFHRQHRHFQLFMRCLSIPSPKPSNNRGEGGNWQTPNPSIINVRQQSSMTFLSCANCLCQIKSPVNRIHFRFGMCNGSILIVKLVTFCTPRMIWPENERIWTLWKGRALGYQAPLRIFNLFTSKRSSCCQEEKVSSFFSLQGSSKKQS